MIEVMAKGKPKLFMQVPRNLFLVLFILSTLLAVYSLRQNNLTMVKLRSAVYQADKENGDVNTALNNLRQYVYSHMNTDLSSGGNAIKPPIQLKYTYERLVAASQKRANNNGLYNEAQRYCQSKIPASVSVSGSGRIACVQDYILSRGGSAAPAIPPALYQFDFASPAWSPDLAGFSLLAAGTFLLAYASRLLADRRHRPAG